MDIQTRKISFIQEFLKLQDEEIIHSLEEFLITKKRELGDSIMEPMSTYQFNKEIDESMNDSKGDRIKKASELKNKHSE